MGAKRRQCPGGAGRFEPGGSQNQKKGVAVYINETDQSDPGNLPAGGCSAAAISLGDAPGGVRGAYP